MVYRSSQCLPSVDCFVRFDTWVLWIQWLLHSKHFHDMGLIFTSAFAHQNDHKLAVLMLPNSTKLYFTYDHRVLAMAMSAVQSVACARLDVVWLLTLHAMAVQGLLGRKKRSYEDLVNECNKAGMADSLELLCRAMVASEMVQQQGSQKLLAELKAAMASKHE